MEQKITFNIFLKMEVRIENMNKEQMTRKRTENI